MNPSYRRDKDHNYMILEAPGRVTGDEFQVRMLILNQIPGVLPCKMRKIDGTAGFYYEITSLQPLARVFEKKKMGQEDIRQLLLGIEKAMNGAREFLLDTDQFLLEPDYIYMDVETREVSLCCLPFYEGNAAVAFRGLAEYILKNLDHGEPGAVLWGYEIYSKTVEENYSIQNVLESVYSRMRKERPAEPEIDEPVFQEVAEEEKQDFAREIPEKDEAPIQEREGRFSGIGTLLRKGLLIAAGLAGVGGMTWGISRLVSLNGIQMGGIFFLGVGILVYFSSIWKGFPKKNKAPKMPPGFEADEILEEVEEPPPEEETEEYGATTLLQAGYAGDYAVLVSMEPGKRENIVLDRDVLTVGKLPGQADIVLDQAVISRVHAKLERKPDGYFVTDQNSTNGTYVNGMRLEAYECRKLHTADEIYFASLGYYFKG
ncbi:MAG: DUF6382 domain-containing protein [Eubacteriales bacterium]|nr:DUF6382 domain-containing protein [Eubacteriales bacterium]